MKPVLKTLVLILLCSDIFKLQDISIQAIHPNTTTINKKFLDNKKQYNQKNNLNEQSVQDDQIKIKNTQYNKSQQNNEQKQQHIDTEQHLHHDHQCVHTTMQEQSTKYQRMMDKKWHKNKDKKNRRYLSTFNSPIANSSNAESIRITIDDSEIDALSPSQVSLEVQTFIKNQLQVAKAFYEKRLKVIRLTSNNYLEYPECGLGYVVPSGKRTVSNSDFHIYATAAPETDKNFLAWAIFCQQEAFGSELKGRPTFARVHYNTHFITKTDDSAFASTIETTLHELAHAFVFSPGAQGLFPHFRDETGAYRNGYTSGFFPYSSQNIVLENQLVRGIETNLIVTPNVKKWAAQHYGCDDLNTETIGPLAGLQLENQGQLGSRGSHWERTVLYDELMTASRFGPTKTFSGATYALFKDSGWYLVNDDEEDKLQWGYKKGCEFLDYTCGSESKFEEFCTIEGQNTCVGGGEVKGKCITNPQQLQNIFMDPGCGIASPYSNAQCIDPEDSQNDTQYKESKQTFKQMEKAPLNYDARCFQSTNLGSQVQCYRYECTLDYKIKIKFREEDGTYDDQQDAECIYKGQQIFNHGSFTGAITCPDPVRFCKQGRRFCPNHCNSKGYCSNGVCVCKWGYGGEDCSVQGSLIASCGSDFDTSKILVSNSETECQLADDCCTAGNSCDVYVNTFNRQCSECDQQCETCQFGGTNKCVTCPSTPPNRRYLLENIVSIEVGECVKICPDGYFPKNANNKCTLCSSSSGNPCRTCLIEDFCNTCQPGDFLDVTNPSDPISEYKGNCQIQSNCVGTYIDTHSKRCFTACPPSRITDNSECIPCSSGQYMNLDTTTCVGPDECPDGTYPDDKEVICQQCHDQCENCFTGGEHGCTSCKSSSSLFLFGNRCLPKQSCPEGSYGNESNNKCSPCHEKCIVCNSENPDQCSQCNVGYYFNSISKTCGTQCPIGTFENKIKNQCTECSENCLTCRKEGEDHCQSCKKGFILLPGFKNKCVDSTTQDCPLNYFNHNSICTKCHYTCKRCTGTSPEQCTLCQTGFYRQTNQRGKSVCLYNCPRLYYGIEQQLDNTHIIGINNRRNLNTDGETGDGEQQQEEEEEEEEPVDDNIEKVCIKCHPSCLKCKGKGENECTKCNQYMFFHNGKCVRQCPNIQEVDFIFRECYSKIQQVFVASIIMVFVLIL